MVIPVVWHTAYQSPNSDLWEFGGERLSKYALFCSLRLLRIGQWPQTGDCVTNRFIVVDFGVCPLRAHERSFHNRSFGDTLATSHASGLRATNSHSRFYANPRLLEFCRRAPKW
jgi:hypothetical protein